MVHVSVPPLDSLYSGVHEPALGILNETDSDGAKLSPLGNFQGAAEQTPCSPPTLCSPPRQRTAGVSALEAFS